MFLLIYITYPDQETAKKISDQLVAERLVACANLFPITSAYWWEGAIQDETEWVSLVKTKPTNWERLEARVIELHPYEVPCILRMEVRANAAYEAWVKESCE